MSSSSESIRVSVPERARALVAATDLPGELTSAFEENAIEAAPVHLDEVVGEVAAGRADLVVIDASTASLRVCRLLKSNPHTHFVPVLVLSPDDPETRRRAYVEGADHVVVEPVDAEEVIARTWSLLRTFHIFRMFEGQRGDLKVRRDWVRYLAHDLGNSLAKVVYHVLFLRRRLPDTDPDALESLDELQRLIDRAVWMLRDLLDVDRIRRGLFPVDPEPIGVAQVAAQVAERLATFAGEHEVLVRIEDGTMRALCDRGLLERILTNLIENAIRFSPRQAEVLIQVVEGDAEALLRVTNRGPAIPVEDRERIFRPFVRLETTASHGTGLGLAFAHLALKLMGGRISVEDPPGGGTAFVVALPRAGEGTA